MPQTPLDGMDAEDFLTGEDDSFDVFDNMDDVREQNRKMAEERSELQQAYASVFTTPEGKKVLNDLLDRYIMRQSFSPRDENADRVGYYFEGQKAAVADIFQKTNQGMKQDD